MTFTTRALGLGVTLAVALSACGGSGSTGSSGSAGSSGAASSAAASSAAPSVPAAGSTVTGTALAGPLTAAMTASPNAALTVKVTGGDGAGGTGSVSFAPDRSSLLLTVPQADAADQPLTMIATADALYIDGATAGAKGKKWVRIKEISDKGDLFTSLFGVLAVGTTSFSNPDGLLRVLAATPSLTVKSADAKGVTYTADLSSAAVVQIFPARMFGGDEKARADMAKRSSGESSQLTLVVDAQGLPTQVTYRTSAEGSPTTITSGYTWGSAEAVTVPDESTVMEAAELEKQLTS